MKHWLKTSITILLCVLVLVGGSGFSLAKMVCFKSGFTHITLSEPDECCKQEIRVEPSPVTLEEKCCDISSMDVTLFQYLVSATQNIHKSDIAADIPSSLVNYNTIDVIVDTKFREHNTPPESSSPPIRVFTKSFLI